MSLVVGSWLDPLLGGFVSQINVGTLDVGSAAGAALGILVPRSVGPDDGRTVKLGACVDC